MHLRTHTGIKNHECEICKERFATAGTLRLHMTRHTDERPCTVCIY